MVVKKYLKASIKCILLFLIAMLLVSCILQPQDPAKKLLGQWEYYDTENGYDAFRYDIEFVSDGIFLIPDTPLLLVNTFEYGFLDGGRLRLTAMGNSIIMEYELEGDILKLIFEDGYNLYRRRGVSPGNIINGQSSNSFCSKVKDIPIEECEALVVLYESTNGEVWKNNGFWLVTKRVKFWDGVDVKDGHVTSLKLNNNQLNGSIPPELSNLSNLQELSFFYSQLTGGIPPELGNLTNLQSLVLTGNQLTGSIPPELGKLTSLKELSLEHNQLTGTIPPDLGNLSNLERFDLGYNQLTGSIPTELGNLNNLERFDLAYNQLTGSLPPELGNLSNLKWLDLSNNQLSGRVPLSFVNLINLERFDIKFNFLCVPSTEKFQAWKATVEDWRDTSSCQ